MQDARDVLRRELRKGALPEVYIRFPRQLGDVVFTLPFLGALQRSWNAIAAEEGVQLRWIAVGHSIGAALFREAAPDFMADAMIESGGKGKPDPWLLLKRWRKARPLAVINLSQSVRLSLAAWLTQVPIRAGDRSNHLGILYHHTFTYRSEDLAIVERFRPLAKALTGSDHLRWEPMTMDRFGGQGGLDRLREAGWKGEPFVTLAFGTRGFGKRWFPEEQNWPVLARHFQDQGYAVVWMGGPEEKELGARLAAMVPGSYDITGRTSLAEATAVQGQATGNVAVDTGLAHTAAATGRPTVTLMGPTFERFFNPLGPFALSIRGAQLDLDDQPLDAETHGSTTHRIPPSRVAEVLGILVGEAKRASEKSEQRT